MITINIILSKHFVAAASATAMAKPSCLLVTMLYTSLVVRAAADDQTTSSSILAPDVSTCLPPLLVPEEELRSGLHCCPPAASYAPRLFRPIPRSAAHHEQLRVRRPAHEADRAYAERLARAYALMRALPSDDPRSFMQQANIHCAYCNTIYMQLNSSTERFQVHGSWLFYPFHRWYLYFHERILAKLLREDGEEGHQLGPFALRFWNYDHPNGSTIPWLFHEVPELRDPRRNPLHAPPVIVSLDVNPSSDGVRPETQLRENAHVMYRAMIRDATSQAKFFGKPYRHGDGPMPGPASVEDEPHGCVHLWTGDYTQVGWKDMGAIYASARDPIFYAHHAQLDRMWEVWRSFEGGNRNLRDEGFLSTEFVFYDENAELVRVRVGDSLDTKALGYVYQEVDLPWKDSLPIRQSRGVAKLTPNDHAVCSLGSPIEKPCSVVLQRDPGMNDSTATEYLVINGTTWPQGFQSFFTIYLNLPSANNETTTGCPEYVGSFRVIDQVRFLNFPANARPSASFDISSRIRDLRLAHQDRIVVTLVPKFGSTNGPSAPVTIAGPIAIQYLT